MKINIQTDEPLVGLAEDLVGNVYQVRGGKGARLGHLHIIVAHYSYGEGFCAQSGHVTLTVDREGNIVGGNSYASHYFLDKAPIAKCEGIEEIQLTVRSL